MRVQKKRRKKRNTLALLLFSFRASSNFLLLLAFSRSRIKCVFVERVSRIHGEFSTFLPGNFAANVTSLTRIKARKYISRRNEWKRVRPSFFFFSLFLSVPRFRKERRARAIKVRKYSGWYI